MMKICSRYVDFKTKNVDDLFYFFAWNYSMFKFINLSMSMILLLVSIVYADLIYDPSTNSYIDDTVENVVVVEIEEEVWTTTSDTDWLVYDPWTWEYVAEENLTERPTWVDEADEADEENEDEEEITVVMEEDEDDASEIASGAVYTGTTEDTLWTGNVLEETESVVEPSDVEINNQETETDVLLTGALLLQGNLETQKNMLLSYLDWKKWEVETTYLTSIQGVFGIYFEEMSSCLQDTQTLDRLSKDMVLLYEELEGRIQSSSADLFADIAYLDYASTHWIYTPSQQEIEWWILSNSIDTFGQNGLLLIDHYIDEAMTSINDFVASTEAIKYEADILLYEERKKIVTELEQVFWHFETSTFFNQTIIWPRADELRLLTDDVFRVFDEQIRMRRWWADNISVLIQEVQNDYLVYVDQVLADLFPADGIADIYKSYSLLEEVYTTSSWDINCLNILQNAAIEEAWPQLITKIQKLQEWIAISNSSVWGASTWAELQEWFSRMLTLYYEDSIIPYIAWELGIELPKENESETWSESLVNWSDIMNIDTSWFTPVQLRQHEKQVALYIEQQEAYTNQVYTAYVDMVIEYLSTLKSEYLENKTLLEFETKMETVYAKVETMLASGSISWNTLVILEAIRTAIEKVLIG